MSAERPRSVDLYRREGDPATRANLKVFSRGTAISLSARVPVLENMGFRVVNERTYNITPQPAAGEAADSTRVWLHDMTLERADDGEIDVARLGPALEAAMMAQFRGLAESDRFDQLVLAAGLAWREASLLRALGRYLRQVGAPYAQGYIADALARHPAIAAGLVALFIAKFDPRLGEGDRGQKMEAERKAIETALDAVSSLDEDRILRRLVNLIDAALRTNFFQIGPDGQPRGTISIKYDCARVDSLPLPRPLYEIFVYSPRVEGIHLRFGKVAAAACAGPTGRRISAPRCSASSRRSRSRTRSSCPSAPRAASCPSTCRRPPTGRPGSPRAPRATASSCGRCLS